MIFGRVRNREIVAGLEVVAPGQLPQAIQAVIDTGYNEYLTLSP